MEDPQKTQDAADAAGQTTDQDKINANALAAKQQSSGIMLESPGSGIKAAAADELRAPTTADVAKCSESIQEHIEDVKDDFAKVEEQAKQSPAWDHAGLKGAIDGFKNRLEHLFTHAKHNAKVANMVNDAPAPAAAPETTNAVQKTRATSDAHLNTGNGGSVTGNPGASFTQASAAQVAVDQGAEIPGVAKVPQPDVAVR